MIMPYIILDVDNTLSLPSEERCALARAGRWDDFYAMAKNDKPNIPVVTMVRMLYSGEQVKDSRQRVHFAVVTGRPERLRQDTIDWIEKYLPGMRYSLCMRNNADHRQDFIIKKEHIDAIRKLGHEILFAIDDRKQCVDMYRREGICCLDCAGNTF